MNIIATTFSTIGAGRLSGISLLLLLLFAPPGIAQPMVWSADTAFFTGAVGRPFAETTVDAWNTTHRWHNTDASDHGRVTWNRTRDTMWIDVEARSAAYVKTDPTSADARLRVTVTGFGSTKLHVVWEGRARVFDNPGRDPLRYASTEQALARLGGVVEIPLRIETDTTLPGYRKKKGADRFDISWDWANRSTAYLSDSSLSDGSGRSTFRLRMVDTTGITEMFGPDRRTFLALEVTESILRKAGLDKKLVDVSRTGFDRMTVENATPTLRLDIAASASFVRGRSTASEIHGDGYLYGETTIRIDGKVSSVEQDRSYGPGRFTLDME